MLRHFGWVLFLYITLLCSIELAAVFLDCRLCLIVADVTWDAQMAGDCELADCAVFLYECSLACRELLHNQSLQAT